MNFQESFGLIRPLSKVVTGGEEECGMIGVVGKWWRGVEEKCKKYFLHLLLHKLSQFSQLQCQ